MMDDDLKTPIPDDIPFRLPTGGDTARVRAIPTRATARPRPRQRYTLRAALVGGVSALALVGLLAAMLAAGIYAYFQALGLIVPGVYVGAIPLGGLPANEAAQKLNAAWTGTQQVTLAAGDRAWKASPAEFGLNFDAQATADRAAGVGRHQGVYTDALDMLDALMTGWAIDPVVRFDEATARDGLNQWAATIKLDPQNATLQIAGDQLVAAPGVDGYQLDVEATVRAIGADPAAPLVTGNLPLILIPIAPRAPDASFAIEQAGRLIAGPLEIAAYDPIRDEVIRFTAQPVDIAAWLSVEAAEDGPKVVVDPGKVGAYIDSLSSQLGEGRFLDRDKNTPILMAALDEDRTATLIVSHAPTQYVIQPGDTLLQIGWDTRMPYWRILDANPGVDADAINPGDTLVIPSKDVLLPLPVVMSKRLVLSITDQRLWLYENGEVIHEYVISTGIDRSPTQPGVFQIQTHDINAYASVWDLYMPHFLGIYEAWPGFMNGFHGLPLLSGGVRLWGDVLGRPASFGCIILDLDDAETLYNWADDGVVVEIRE